MERIGRVFISLQQIKRVPRMLTEAAPSMPNTVRDTEVPHYFREPYVFTSYRLRHQRWRYYFLSLFQHHNETINIWTHLLAFLVFLVKFRQLSVTVDFVSDPHSWPLLVLMLSSMIYTACSVAAHLLAAKSEMCHYSFFFVDYVGVSQYQYGSAVVHFYYAVDEGLHRRVQGIFMPMAIVFSCLSCLGCCYGKYYNHSRPTWVYKVSQLVPLLLAFIWDISPIAERLMTCSTGIHDPATLYHFSQVVLSFSTTFFFTCPILQCCFPGRCDFMGQSHQFFHVSVSCFTLSQIHSSYLDFVGRRKLYSRLHGSSEAALFVRLYVVDLILCAAIAAFILKKVKQTLDLKIKST